MDKLRFDGRVAIVTGAGGGLGREYALLLADRGASVVVNDLGGSMTGDGGKSASPADKVVDEIKAKGGKAVANYDSVEDGDKIVETAIKNFGRIDIVINNAGILRDRTFARTSNEDWDLIHRVHLRGSFLVTRAAWPHFRKQKYGRVIMTASQAGVCGNFGQANYSAAKLGLLGLSNTLAKEGAKDNILCNTIVPMCGSRLTQNLLPPELFDDLKPAYVAPVVAFLCHESCPENGGAFEAAGSWVGEYSFRRSRGVAFGPSIDPEKVRDAWKDIVDPKDADRPTDVTHVVGLLGQAITEAKSGPEPLPYPPPTGSLSPEHAKRHSFRSSRFSYTVDKPILYALSLGISVDGPDALRYLYEGHEDFGTIPTYGTIIASDAMLGSGVFTGSVPGLNIDLVKVLHGEQYTEILKPLPTDAILENKPRIVDVLDKGSGAAIVLEIETKHEDELIMRNQFVIFVVGAGGFGGPRNSPQLVPVGDVPANRRPDVTAQHKTNNDQAALYRMNGDINPLHIDPNFASMAGYKKPILHGLCSYGITAYEVIRHFAGGDVTKFKAMKARFAKPVYPGETLTVDMWRDGNRIYYESKVIESGNSCLKGFIDLTQVTAGPQTSSGPTQGPSQATLDCDPIFADLSKVLGSNPDMAKGINAVFLWNITKKKEMAAQWTLDLKNQPYSLYRSAPIAGSTPNATLTLEDEDVVKIFGGKISPQVLFMKGQLKIAGNIPLTQKLQPLFQQHKNKL